MFYGAFVIIVIKLFILRCKTKKDKLRLCICAIGAMNFVLKHFSLFNILN